MATENQPQKRYSLPERTYSAAAMRAVQVLEILGKANLRAVINKSCGTGEITIPPNLMRDLADGTALKPQPVGEREHGKLNILNPADYPTDLIQVAFEAMRRRRNFRAAWVFALPRAEMQSAKPQGYQLLFLMDPRDDAIFHEVNLAVQTAHRPTVELRLGLLEEKDAEYVEGLFRQARPFYVAADYPRPPGALV